MLFIEILFSRFGSSFLRNDFDGRPRARVLTGENAEQYRDERRLSRDLSILQCAGSSSLSIYSHPTPVTKMFFFLFKSINTIVSDDIPEKGIRFFRRGKRTRSED